MRTISVLRAIHAVGLRRQTSAHVVVEQGEADRIGLSRRATVTSLEILGASVGVLEGQRNYRFKRRR